MIVGKKNIADSILHVPNEFRLHHPFPYPPDNTLIFEEWFYENFKSADVTEERIYLPIFWTSYYVTHRFGQDKKAMSFLQFFLNTLDTSKKYYTIVQYDDGILNDVSHLDLKIFGMGGGRIDYPLPLLCQPHNYEFNDLRRNKFASFVGKKTHPIREELFKIDKEKLLKSENKYYILDAKHSLVHYCQIMATSIFSLCPRGYGKTSFRILESLQYGAIPVYISDEFIIPHNIPFENYGVLLQASEIENIDKTLSEISATEIKRKQEAIKDIFEMYFTYEANKKLLLKINTVL